MAEEAKFNQPSREKQESLPVELEAVDNFDTEQMNPRWDISWRIKPESLLVTDELNPGGKKCLKISVHPGDISEPGDQGIMTERAEITERPEVRVPSGVDIWYGFNFFIPKDFQVNDNRLVIAQWKSPSKGGESPVISLRYQEGELIGQVMKEDERVKFKYPNVEMGVWNQVMANYLLNDNHEGHCEFVLNGKTFGTYAGEMGKKGLPSHMYYKMGLYRDHVSYPQSMYFDRFRRGESREFCEK